MNFIDLVKTKLNNDPTFNELSKIEIVNVQGFGNTMWRNPIKLGNIAFNSFIGNRISDNTDKLIYLILHNVDYPDLEHTELFKEIDDLESKQKLADTCANYINCVLFLVVAVNALVVKLKQLGVSGLVIGNISLSTFSEFTIRFSVTNSRRRSPEYTISGTFPSILDFLDGINITNFLANLQVVLDVEFPFAAGFEKTNGTVAFEDACNRIIATQKDYI